jgi:hypothetical protein
VGVGEADALVEHERGVHELEAHILRKEGGRGGGRWRR